MMPEDATFNSTALPSAISESAAIHVMDQEFISWALYDLSRARTPASLETMQYSFRRFCGLRGKSLEGIAYDGL